MPKFEKDQNGVPSWVKAGLLATSTSGLNRTYNDPHYRSITSY